MNGYVEIVVTDTGQGIAADVLPFIFDRFRQADSSSTRTHSGLGLGLALVKHLVDVHGGTVTADSAGPGCGATFVVRLPLQTTETRADGGPRRAHVDPDAARVRLDGLRVGRSMSPKAGRFPPSLSPPTVEPTTERGHSRPVTACTFQSRWTPQS